MIRTFHSALVPLVAALLVSGCGDQERPASTGLVTPVIYCALDSANGTEGVVLRVKQGPVRFQGWMAGNTKSEASDKVVLELKSGAGKTYPFEGAERMARPDVARAMSSDAHLNAGFKLMADLSTLEKGSYGIAIRLLDPHGVLLCQVKKNVIVE
ncbi:hypothetical protein [Pseudomonas parasichuanensis]|uniref:hypothetical protein n=1 Tax=Pseudomonas parasichuanensis TaxID=2892329 RepID=UPI001F2289B7|nr:hypothetical protein [Pseudomonas parasichuanensis]